ncbi:MAG: hypothetical protein ACPGOY_16470 [Rhodospirillaceae bacterium]
MPLKPVKPLKPHEQPLIRFMFLHLLTGVIGAALFTFLILFFDIGSIGSMVFNSEDGILFSVLLFFGLFVTFGGVAMGIGVMSMAEDKY